MSPQEALGSFTENLDRRFRDFDATFRSKLIDAMKHEDKLLSQYIEKNQLAKWVLETHQIAQTEVNNVLDEATKSGSSEANGQALGAALFQK